MLKCTVPKCRGRVKGFTGLDEIVKLRRHFARAHKLPLSMEEALEVRIDLEEGREPNVMRAMLGTDRLNQSDK